MPQIPTDVLVIAATGVAAIVLLMAVFANLYRKAGPHEALVVYGFRGTREIKGHGTVILPMVENCRELSLELMSFDVAPQQDLYTKQGVAVTVEAVAQIKVKSDPESILTAAEQFLTKPPEDREALIRLVMEGHLRGIIGQLTVEEIVKQPEMVADRMRSTCADDINKMGLEVISFTIKEVRDKNDYITNMGRPDIVRIKRDADVAAAEADRDTAIKRAIALRESAVAKAQADQERVAAETASMARQAAALTSAGAGKSGIPCARFTALWRAASTDMPRITLSANRAALCDSRGSCIGSLGLDVVAEAKRRSGTYPAGKPENAKGEGQRAERL